MSCLQPYKTKLSNKTASKKLKKFSKKIHLSEHEYV